MSPIKFKSLTAPEQFRFLEDDLGDLIERLGEFELYLFFKAIVLDDSVNANIRKIVLATLTDCVILNKIKIRHALAVLIDEWNIKSDVFLQLQRLKDLYYYYSEEKTTIESIYLGGIDEQEGEISSECAYNLGQICFQDCFAEKDRDHIVRKLTAATHYFHQADQIIENRIDAKFYKTCTRTLVDMLNQQWNGVDKNLSIMAKCFYQHEIFSFNCSSNPHYLGFYRILCSLNTTIHETPDQWLDVRAGLNQLFVEYAEINNQQLKDRLNESITRTSFINLAKTEFLEPYYVLNLSPQLTKIDLRLSEIDNQCEEFRFLIYIKSLFTEGSKKKIDQSIKQKLTNIFPYRNNDVIDQAIGKIKDLSNSLQILSAYAALQVPTFDEFLDRLVNACLTMQGNRLYRGGCLENDRNSFVATIVEASQHFNVKDQTRWSVSHAGKDSGEIDILVYEKDGTPYSIIEGINLDSLDSEYLGIHLTKIFKYDTSGFENNVILVYSTSKQFDKFSIKYKTFIDSFNFPYLQCSSQPVTSYRYTDMKFFKGIHRRNDNDVFLYHILINLI